MQNLVNKDFSIISGNLSKGIEGYLILYTSIGDVAAGCSSGSGSGSGTGSGSGGGSGTGSGSGSGSGYV